MNFEPYKKPIKLVVNMPGNSWGLEPSKCWDKLHNYLMQRCEKLWVSREYFPGVEAVRNKVLEGAPHHGEKQVPYQGKLDYTHMLWIDQDVTYTIEDFEKLLSHDLDIVSGYYPTTDGTLCLGAMGVETDDALSIKKFRKKGLEEVNFNGMGFWLNKYGVFETLGYPWFIWEPQSSENIHLPVPATEDISVCQRLRKRGYKIYVDTEVSVTHWKTVPLRAATPE